MQGDWRLAPALQYAQIPAHRRRLQPLDNTAVFAQCVANPKGNRLRRLLQLALPASSVRIPRTAPPGFTNWIMVSFSIAASRRNRAVLAHKGEGLVLPCLVEDLLVADPAGNLIPLDSFLLSGTDKPLLETARPVRCVKVQQSLLFVSAQERCGALGSTAERPTRCAYSGACSMRLIMRAAILSRTGPRSSRNR